MCESEKVKSFFVLIRLEVSLHMVKTPTENNNTKLLMNLRLFIDKAYRLGVT